MEAVDQAPEYNVTTLSNGFTVLTHAGKVSHARMEQQIEPMFKDFEQRRKQQEAARADSQDEAELKALENTLKKRVKP